MLFSYFCFLFTLSYFIVVFLFFIIIFVFYLSCFILHLIYLSYFLLLLGSRPIFLSLNLSPNWCRTGPTPTSQATGPATSDQQPRRKAGPRPAGPLPSRTQQARRALRPSSRTLLLPFSLSRARDSAHDVTWPSFLLLSPPLQACSSLFLNGSHDMAPRPTCWPFSCFHPAWAPPHLAWLCISSDLLCHFFSPAQGDVKTQDP